MVDVSERDRLLAEWEQSKVELENAKIKEMTLRKQVVEVAFPEDTKEGTNRIPLANGFALKYVRKINYKLEKDNALINPVYDAVAALGNEGPFIAERILKRVYDFGAGEYKKLDANNPTHAAAKALIDKVLTTSDAAPALEIEEPKAKK